MSYCKAVKTMSADSGHQHYHNKEYGFPLKSDSELFGRLILEINQAGLSWTTILNKKENFERAYGSFNIDAIANFKARDKARLMQDAGIIRNRLKIEAAIENAKKVLLLQKEFGSFKGWLDHHHPQEIGDWVKLFRSTFRFTGGEIVKEFLMSTGYLKGAHDPDCPVYHKVLKKKPAWIKAKSK